MKRIPFFELLQESSRRRVPCCAWGWTPGWMRPRPRSPPPNRRIIDETCHAACLYKPNAGFYEARGTQGMEALKKTIDYVHAKGMPVLLDAKRGDIASTAAAYAKAVFEVLDADAVTLNPLLGADSVEPFLQHAGRGLFLLCHTSNPGARTSRSWTREACRSTSASRAPPARGTRPGQSGLSSAPRTPTCSPT